jgi:hypothetical protein
MAMYISSHSSQKVRHPQFAGIDKIEMTFSPGSFSVADYRQLDMTTRQRAGTNVPPLLVDGHGVEVVATKLHHNTPGGTTFDIDHRGLFVSMNPSKLATGHPFELLTEPSKLMEVGSHVLSLANAVGIDMNVHAGQLYRVDTTKQNIMDEPVSVYGQALRYARATRMNRKEYPDGHLVHNSNRELCFYDKQKELTRKGKGRAPLTVSVPDNFLRAESRIMGRDTVTKDMGCATFGDLLNIDPIVLARVYGKNMDRLLFHPLNAGQQMSISFAGDLAYIHDLATRYGKSAWKVYERLHGTLSLLDAHGGMDGVERFLWALHDAGGVSRPTVYRRLAQLRHDVNERATLDHIRGQRSVATRLEEIRHTFTTIPNAA